MSNDIVIDSIDVTVLKGTPDPDNRQRLALVAVTASDGTVGYAEAAASPWAVQSYLNTRSLDEWDGGVRDLLLGLDAQDPQSAWTKLRSQTFWSGRTGLGYVACAAVDTALWDLAGKIGKVPSWQVAGSAGASKLRAYATLYHGRASLAYTLERIATDFAIAQQMGFTAIKVEAMPENTANKDEIVRLVEGSREIVGDDVDLMLDVGYRWTSSDEALDCARRLEPFNLRFLEAPFPPEFVMEYQLLVAGTSIPIASGDMLTAPQDFIPLFNAGVSIVQAGSARTGYSGMHEVARQASQLGVQFVPWGFVGTSIAAAANVHACVSLDNVPLIESAPPQLCDDVPLRAELSGPDPKMTDGYFERPTLAGFGVDIDMTAFDRFAANAANH